jgi:predicted membrane protein
MWTPLIATGGATVLFVLYLLICVYEERNGQRFFLGRFRLWLDTLLEAFTNRVTRLVRHVVKYTITLSWYYSLHTFLKLVLQFLAGIYHMIEAVLLRNRDKALVLRKEKRTSVSHLTQIADHKEEVKLTDKEAKKRKDKALKGH